MVSNRQVFDRHFNTIYKDNPYVKLDALVWSTIFFEKVQRYSDEVYIMTEYFYKNYLYI